MEINQRIKQLRNEILKNENNKKYSVQEFSNLLGVSRGVIENIEYNRVIAKDNIINLICLTFNVNKNWLINGEEPIFNNEKNNYNINILELLKNEYDLTDNQLILIKNILNMSNKSRNIFIELIKDCFKDIN